MKGYEGKGDEGRKGRDRHGLIDEILDMPPAGDTLNNIIIVSIINIMAAAAAAADTTNGITVTRTRRISCPSISPAVALYRTVIRSYVDLC